MNRPLLTASITALSVRAPYLFFALVIFLLTSCGGGGSGSGQDGGGTDANFGCNGTCANQALTASEVTQIIQQGIAGADALGVRATFSVLDRVGNVLAVYQMSGAQTTTTINGQIGAQGGLEGLTVPATLAAISKAGTGAYLSSQGNAFSSRTASQIIQENFNPGERNQAGGPLFGVQFSQLLCSDVNLLDRGASGGVSKQGGLNSSTMTGPRPLPLGLSADPGGIPLYKQGDLVGGIGVEFDGVYRVDRDISDFDNDPEERIALTASLGFEAPSERTAPNISVGKYLRYTDLTYNDIAPLPTELPALDPSSIVSVGLFFNGTIRGGVPYGSLTSGVFKTVRAGKQAAVLVDAGGSVRFPTRAGSSRSDGKALTASEVDALLDSALITASRARGAIRRPLDSAAEVSIWVVDEKGIPLGFTRSPDAPIFGIDVALQKARSAALLSSSDAASVLTAAGMSDYVGRASALLGSGAFSDGFAFTDRAIGNLSRPFYVDGINGNGPGPFSLPFPGQTAASNTWSPFNTGLQLDLSFVNLARSLGLLGAVSSIPNSCADSNVFGRRLANGLQIFPGSVPLYRDGTLIGGVGISGDGVDQDDLIAFYGSSRRGLDFAGHTSIGDTTLGFNSPLSIRSDVIDISVKNTRLRYINCPEGPFVEDNDQNVCEGL